MFVFQNTIFNGVKSRPPKNSFCFIPLEGQPNDLSYLCQKMPVYFSFPPPPKIKCFSQITKY